MVECRGYILSPARGILHGSLGLPKALPGYRRVQFGCSNGFTAHSHAPRLPDIRVKGTSARNFARWNRTTNLPGPWTLMTMSVLVLQQSFKDWVFSADAWHLVSYKHLKIQKFCASPWPSHQKQNILLQNSATQQCLHWTLRKYHQHQLVQSAPVTDGRAVTKPGLVISLILSSKGNLLEWPDISGCKYDLKGQVHGRVARIAASQIQTSVEAFGWKVISVFVAWRCPRRRIIVMEF